MQSLTLQVISEVGLHARPAAEFVKQAGRFQSGIQVRNISKGTAWVDAKSILSILTLGVEKGHEIELKSEGADEETAIRSLSDLIASDFNGMFT